ncbi:hypothetical protein B0J13DRAFT_154773 [Dactylonectria estremocensis]|uniref:Uncharacterized protein n=1 Tax=Dactylonectria estremocensis TaxID=1079267 RepID=A0A9P9DMM3_9HYPO|nr:hypothetical protein B0J13DRAFT_154773 [Dactylonectria estremocensis]
MRFSFISLLPLVTLAEAQWKSCARFWDKIPPSKTDYTIHSQCHIFPGYPKTIAHTKVYVEYTKKWDAAHHNKDVFAPVLDQAIEKSIVRYSKFAPLPDAMIIFLTTAAEPGEVAETVYPVVGVSKCQTKLYNTWTKNAAGFDKPAALQGIAHELYHCVQELEFENVVNPRWVIDGSANYMSNVVFPTLNAEWPSEGYSYNPSVPIYAQAGVNVYGTSIFFQAMEDTWGVEGIHKWVMDTDLGQPERSRLSKLAGFPDDFFLFAKQYSTGRIEDTMHIYIPGLPKPETTTVKVTFNKAGTVGTATLKTMPFTIRVFKMSLQSGQTAEIFSDADSSQRLAYRRATDKNWQTMPKGSASDSEGTFSIPCNTKGTAESFFVLFISTADAKSDSAKITIKRQKKKDCSKPSSGGFVLYPLFVEATSGARCPAGTHFSSTAAWCCPEGMELDQAVASEASICCPTAADCSKSIIPNNLHCADSDWVLWSRDFRSVGCCMKGYVPNSQRYCVTDASELGPRFSQIPQS